MDDFKAKAAQDFKNILDEAKKEKKKSFDMTEAWFGGIAKRVHADPKSKKMSEIVSAFSAYHEFEDSKLRMALKTPKYNPLSKTNRNDILDAEQLVYLGDKSLCLLTCDKGFKKRVKKSDQVKRLIIVAPEELMDATKAEALREKRCNESEFCLTRLRDLPKKSFADVNKFLAKTQILFEEVPTLNGRSPVEDARNKVTISFRVQ